VLTIAEARERVLAAVRPLPAEVVPLEEALGRVLAEEVRSDEDLPPFDSSAMDGYAVVAGPARELPVVGESRAGRPASRALQARGAMRISTGAAVPEGADAVVPVERVEILEGGGEPASGSGPATGGGSSAEPAAGDPGSDDGGPGACVRVPETRPGDHIRRAGEDVPAGSVVIPAGTELGPAEVAVLAALGIATVRCGARPRVTVLVTAALSGRARSAIRTRTRSPRRPLARARA
jgi:molybdopterin molybdotransferase